MLRSNLRTAIGNSGLVVKEIAAKSGVNKRTIDKWVGTDGTEPRVKDLYEVCKVLGVTVEWLFDGEQETGYNPSEREFLTKYRRLDDQGQYEIRALLDAKLIPAKKYSAG